jgi:enoyl-CoA hydratase/carnithine racemase
VAEAVDSDRERLMTEARYGDVTVSLENHVAWVEIHRPPHNYFDPQLIGDVAGAFEALDQERECRALVLASEGKSFCAGADFTEAAQSGGNELESSRAERVYAQAIRLFATRKPVVAAIQGAAVGGGLGLALTADFRVVSPLARFSGNFTKLGLHPGFGVTHTLPRLIGVQRASLMFYTARRITGEEAVAWGLADVLASPERLRDEARKLAGEIAECAPLAVQATRATLRRGLADAVKAALEHELAEQGRLARTADHKEGIRAVSERRAGRFEGR